MDISKSKSYVVGMMLDPNSYHTLFIETPRGSFVKWNEVGSIDFISPLPSPFHYGHVVGFQGGDGDPLDALYIGKLRTRTMKSCVVGVVRFVDNDQQDDKWIFSDGKLSQHHNWLIYGFFSVYALCKNLVAKTKGRANLSYIQSIEFWDDASHPNSRR